MKKIISTILSITLLMCMSVTAFAADNQQSQTVTTTIPDREFTMTIPAKTNIQYGYADVVTLDGELKITSTNSTLLFSNNHYVNVEMTYGDLMHTDNNNYTLPLSIFYAKPADATSITGGYTENYTWENFASGGSVNFNSDNDFYWKNGYRFGAKITAWENAEPGEYQTTVTYTATIKQK